MIQIRSEPQPPKERIAASVSLPDHNGPRRWLPVEPIERIIVGAEVLQLSMATQDGGSSHCRPGDPGPDRKMAQRRCDARWSCHIRRGRDSTGWFDLTRVEQPQRRSQKSRMTWPRPVTIAERWLPKPSILHPYPNLRFDAKHPR
jgi:hypothetical protein